MNFRKINGQDSDRIYQIKLSIFPQGEYQSKEENEIHCKSGNGICCLTNGKIVGFLMYHLYPHEVTGKDVLTITSFGVDKEYSNQGVGGNIFARAVFILKEYNIYLHVRKSNFIAQKIYEKHVFKKVMEIKDYYSWTSINEDGIYLEKIK